MEDINKKKEDVIEEIKEEEKTKYTTPKLHIHGKVKSSANEVTTVTYYY